MCVLATALTAAAGLAGAVGSVVQGNAQARAYEAQADAARRNARVAELTGQRELEKGAREEQRFRRQARQFQGSQRTALAASGAQMSGSALNVLADTAGGIEEDAATLRYNTLQNKYGYDVQATNFRNQANAADASASNARSAGWFGGFTTLLSTGAGLFAGASTGATIKHGGGIEMPKQPYYEQLVAQPEMNGGQLPAPMLRWGFPNGNTYDWKKRLQGEYAWGI